MRAQSENWSEELLTINPKRIMIVRLGGISEVLTGLPVLNTLRTRYPRAEIAWLLEERFATLLYGHIALDRLIIARKGWLKSLDELRLLRKRLLAFAPDVAIDLQGSFKSSFASWLSGAKIRIGFGGRDAREGSRWINNVKVVPEKAHRVERNLQLLRPLGIHGSSVDFELPECEADRFLALRVRRELQLEGNFAIINVGADSESQQWRSDRFAELCHHLGEQWNLPSMVIGGTVEERDMAIQVVSKSGGHARLAPSMTLLELASLAKMSTLFVSGDAAPLHLAAALGTPWVGLFDPIRGDLNGPYGRHNHVVQIASQDEELGNGSREPGREYMDAIDLEHLAKACDAVLSRIIAEENAAQSIMFPGENQEIRRIGA